MSLSCTIITMRFSIDQIAVPTVRGFDFVAKQRHTNDATNQRKPGCLESAYVPIVTRCFCVASESRRDLRGISITVENVSRERKMPDKIHAVNEIASGSGQRGPNSASCSVE